MIERQIVAQKNKEKAIENFIFSYLGKLSCSRVKMQRTPLGEKVSIYTSRPGVIVGRKGANIARLTEELKHRFNMENPQLEVVEIENPYLDAATVVRTLISGFERFGPKRFKAMAYKALDETMRAGARGIEIVISGRGVPGERAKSWRFLAGYLKKSGDIAANHMDIAIEGCNLRSGTVGIKVSILHPDVLLPDEINFKKLSEVKAEVKQEEVKAEENTEAVKEAESVKPVKTRTRKKKTESTTEEKIKTDGNNKE